MISRYGDIPQSSLDMTGMYNPVGFDRPKPWEQYDMYDYEIESACGAEPTPPKDAPSLLGAFWECIKFIFGR